MRVKSNIDAQQLYTIGDRLRALRDAHYLTQEQLSEALGVQRETVGQWERGVTPPSFSAIVKICDLYHVDADYIMGRLDCQTHDLQYVHDLTGLSEDAIKKLIQFKRKNKANAYSDIVSLLLEYFNAEFLLSLIGRRISMPPSTLPKNIKDSQIPAYMNMVTMRIDIDGTPVVVDKNNLIDSQISTTIIRDLPEIVRAYRQQHDQTPAERAAAYKQFHADLIKRIEDARRAGTISTDDLTPQLRAAIDEYLKS